NIWVKNNKGNKPIALHKTSCVRRNPAQRGDVENNELCMWDIYTEEGDDTGVGMS
ncbi:hypothetical protein J6590_026117, partial [Homalodisca vitripennis]